MIQIKTKTEISLSQAIEFEISQNAKGISKTGMFSVENCHWLLKVENPEINNGFKAKVSWYQLQNYKPDENSEDTAIREVQMFYEDFTMSKTEMKAMFDQVGLSITAGVHDPSDRWIEITSRGVINWLENIRKVFGEGVEFEII